MGEYFDVYQLIFIIGAVIYLILRFIVYFFLKSIGEPQDEKYLRGIYSKETIEYWATKLNSKQSKKMFQVVKRIRFFWKVIIIFFFIIPIAIKIVLLLFNNGGF